MCICIFTFQILVHLIFFFLVMWGSNLTLRFLTCLTNCPKAVSPVLTVTDLQWRLQHIFSKSTEFGVPEVCGLRSDCQLCLFPAAVGICGDNLCAALTPKGHWLMSSCWASFRLSSVAGLVDFWRTLFYSVDLFIYTRTVVL